MAQEHTGQQSKSSVYKYGLVVAAMLILAIVMLHHQIMDRVDWHYRSNPKESDRIVTLCKDMIVENWHDSRRYTSVKFSMFAKASDDSQDHLRKVIASHEGQVRDMIRSTVANVNQWDMQDPKLKVVKQKVNENLETIVGPHMIDQILITDWASTQVYR